MKKPSKNDLFLIAFILLAALAIYLCVRPGKTGAWAVITIDGMETARYPLYKERTVTLGGADAYNVLQIADGAARITDANCGDHTCMRTGAVAREGEVIVCLPHRLTVRIEDGANAGLDGVTG